MTLKPNFNTQLSDKRKLIRIAKSLGYVQTRGETKGNGSIRQLLEAIIAGEVTLTQATAPAAALSEAQKRELLHARLAQQGHRLHPAKRLGQISAFRPVTVKGEPVSEMLIRERR